MRGCAAMRPWPRRANLDGARELLSSLLRMDRAGWELLCPDTGLTIVRCLANYQRVSSVFKALADPTRRRVLQLLRERPMTAGELSEHFAVSKPTMSAHFSVLQEADLIQAEKTGRSIVYRLKMSVLEDALLGFAQTFGWDVKAIDPDPLKGKS